MKKVLFIMPPIGGWATHGVNKAANQYYAQLAAYIRAKEVAEPFVLDARALDLSYDDVRDRVREMKPDLVVLGDILHSTGGLAVIWHFNKTARIVKEASPATRVAVGGLWYSALYKETIEKEPAIDFVLIGEGELTLEDLCRAGADADFSKIPGLACRQNGAPVAGPHRALIGDIDILPLPAYDLFPMEKYVNHTYWTNFCELFTSRGCPGGCSFCYEWSQYDPRSPKDFVSWRSHSAGRIVEELELLTTKFGVKTVVFQDDAFNVNPDMVRGVCEGILARGIKLNWVILGRADDWDRQGDLIPLMKKAGLFMGLVGIEVGDDADLSRLGKGVTVAQIKRTVDTLRKNDVATVGTFMIGFEDDDEEKIKHRFQFADEVDPDVFALQFVTPVPGSPLWKKLVKEGILDPEKIDLIAWDFQHPVVPTKQLSIEEVGRLGSWCMREFFSKPHRIHRIMGSRYSDLAKLCIKDFMANISKFEAAATKGDLYV
ncbi:MAG: B12-binding domain-containing radical SAM protein [Deltaproteobacteria bacterium]